MKRLLFLIFVLVFVSSVYAACDYTTRGKHGISIEGICYDCGVDDEVCPSDFNGVDCSANPDPDCAVVAPTTTTHKVCSGTTCVDVKGVGTDGCTSDSQCTTTPTGTHMDCSSNQCILVNGAGSNICTTDAGCAITTTTHKVCSGTTCVDVNGVGTDGCTSDSQCTTTPTGTHMDCSSNQCILVNEAGSNLCTTDAGCVTPSACTSCSGCGSGALNLCDENECSSCGSCYFIDGILSNSCKACSSMTCEEIKEADCGVKCTNLNCEWNDATDKCKTKVIPNPTCDSGYEFCDAICVPTGTCDADCDYSNCDSVCAVSGTKKCIPIPSGCGNAVNCSLIKKPSCPSGYSWDETDNQCKEIVPFDIDSCETGTITKCSDYPADACEENLCELADIGGTVSELDSLEDGTLVCALDLSDVCGDFYICTIEDTKGCVSSEEDCTDLQENENIDNTECDCDYENLETECPDQEIIDFCKQAEELAGEEEGGAVTQEQPEKFPIFTWFNLIISSVIIIGFYAFVHRNKRFK